MMQLDERERGLLLRVLRNTLPDLRMTISDTENYEWRQEMKRDEELMKSLIARLESEVASQAP